MPTLGLAFAANRVLYPFLRHFARLARGGADRSDTASNILFGNLQKITSTQLGLSPILDGSGDSETIVPGDSPMMKPR